MSNKLVYVDDIIARAHDVTLEGGAKHRCFDVTLLHELNAVELIRCKDCKHDNDGRCSWHESLRYTWIVDDDDYCSCAERREE